MSESDETKKERREKAIALSIKLQREAFSRMARDLARIIKPPPATPEKRSFDVA